VHRRLAATPGGRPGPDIRITAALRRYVHLARDCAMDRIGRESPGEIARDGRCRADVDRMPMEAAAIELTRQQVEALKMSK
jgi:hypothetical protein